MRKYIRNVLVVIGVFMLSCSKESLEPFPVEPSFEAPEEALKRYSEILEGGKEGWEFTLSGQETGFYAGYFRFSPDQSAMFTTDAYTEGHTALKSLSYRFAVEQTNPTLRLGGSDFESFVKTFSGFDSVFSFQSVRGDTVFLRGDQFGSTLTLRAATAEKAEAFLDGGIDTMRTTLGRWDALPYYFKTLSINGAPYDLYVNTSTKKLRVHFGGARQYQVFESRYAYTASGIVLEQALVDGVNSFRYIDDLKINPTEGTLSARVNGLEVPFTNEAAPSAYDTAAARHFYDNPTHQIAFRQSDNSELIQRYSVSREVFSEAGNPDVYQFGNIPGYQFLTFFHQWMGQDYGVFWLAINTGTANQLSNYGMAFKPRFSEEDGLIGFEYAGTTGTFPSETIASFQQFLNTLADSYGFYVIQADNGAYDLVSRNPSATQKWIRFE